MSVHALMTLIFRLEADRTEALCALRTDEEAPARIAAVDARLQAAMGALAERGARYPLHMLAETSALSQADYIVLQLAMIGRQGPERTRRVTALLGGASQRVRLDHAVALLASLNGPEAEPHPEVMRIFDEGLVKVVGPDEVLEPGQAVIELMGW